MKIETLDQAKQFIVLENDYKIVVKTNKEAADWISQEQLDKGGTGGAIYGPFKENYIFYWVILKNGANEAHISIYKDIVNL